GSPLAAGPRRGSDLAAAWRAAAARGSQLLRRSGARPRSRLPRRCPALLSPARAAARAPPHPTAGPDRRCSLYRPLRRAAHLCPPPPPGPAGHALVRAAVGLGRVWAVVAAADRRC